MIRVNVLIVIKFSEDDIVYLCNSEEDINFENQVYMGAKTLNVSSVGGGTLTQPGKVSIEILGIEEADRNTFRTKLSPPPVISLQAIAKIDGPWVKIGQEIKGSISSPRLIGGKYTCEIASRSAIANSNRIIFWSHEDRVRRFGQEDQGMAQMLLFEKKEVYGTWPNFGQGPSGMPIRT